MTTATATAEFRPRLWTPGDWNAFFGFGTPMSALQNLASLIGDPVARCARPPPRPGDADSIMVGHRPSCIVAPIAEQQLEKKKSAGGRTIVPAAADAGSSRCAAQPAPAGRAGRAARRRIAAALARARNCSD